MIVYLAHGASGSAASMRPHVEGLTERGITARAVALPVGRAEKAVEVYRRQVDQLELSAIGGHSYGGRVASLLAAEQGAREASGEATEEGPRGLVLLSYPLHRPGRPDELRVAHWPAIKCPVLLLSGESDPFARIDLLRAAVEKLSSPELVTYPRVGHGLAPVLDDALDRIAWFAQSL